MKKYGIVLINVLIMLGILTFLTRYVSSESRQRVASQITAFENMNVAMERVTANYLEGEQRICDVWARYIDDSDMTLEEAAAFVRASHVLANTSAHILTEKDGVLQGLSILPRAGTTDDYAVSYANVNIFRNASSLGEIGSGINITRAYTNPNSGIQSLAFCNRIHLLGDKGQKLEGLLLRVVPVSELAEKWTFPSEEYANAEISLIDSAGSYIIKGRSFKNSDFLEFYSSYNETDNAKLKALRETLNGSAGSFQMLDSKGEHCLVAHAPVIAAGDWTILGLVKMDDLNKGTVDWLLLGVVAAGLVLLLLVDLLYMTQLNNRLRIAAMEAENASRAKTDFLSTMSHDIRTPMNAITGLAAIAEKNAEDAQRVRENLHKIRLAGNHLLTLINDILDISKVESGKLNLSPVSFSIVETAENLVNLSQPMVREKNIAFNFRINRVLHEELYADKLRLNQIFINILSNAIKYTEPGGNVNVDLYEQESTKPGCVQLLYRVSDTGIGMSEEFMQRMYQPFSRQTDSRVNSIQGTGLGLAITKQMVELMGGSIDCKSKEGEGTTFTVLIDIPYSDRPAEEMHLENAELLLVDDDEVLLETAKDTIASLGARAETVADGAQAIELAGERHRAGKDFDAVIVDWQMPGMDGIEVVRQVRAVTGDEVPILLISAYDWSDIEEAAHLAGANGFISKPLFRSTLYEKLSVLMGRQSEQTTQEDDNADLADMRILVAEDNDINWEVVSTLLQMSGITCTRARNGAEAVEMMRGTGKDDFDMIFMDIQMPIMNGLEATRAIRALPDKAAASIPIIAMTADAFSENVAECLAVGMNGHVAKPIDLGHVLKEIRKVKEMKTGVKAGEKPFAVSP